MSCKGFCSFGRRLSKRKTHRKLTDYQKFMKKKLKEIYDRDKGINPKSAIKLAAQSWSKHKKGSKKFGSALSQMYENMTVKPFLTGNKFGSNTLHQLQNIKPSGKPITMPNKYGRKIKKSKKHRFGSHAHTTKAPGSVPNEMSVYQQYTGESPSQWKHHYESIPTNLKPNFYQNIPKDVPSTYGQHSS